LRSYEIGAWLGSLWHDCQTASPLLPEGQPRCSQWLLGGRN